jgi:hypothetical protein
MSLSKPHGVGRKYSKVYWICYADGSAVTETEFVSVKAISKWLNDHVNREALMAKRPTIYIEHRPAWQMMGLQPALAGKQVVLRRVGKQAYGGKS